MSIKSLIQLVIIFFIIIIIGSVYYNYFDTKKNIVEEINSLENENLNRIEQLQEKISKLENDNKILSNEIEENKNKQIIVDNANQEIQPKTDKKKDIIKSDKKKIQKKISQNKKEIKNLVKDVEYTSVDQKGNKFHLLASSGKSNPDNNDILDLINVRGKITSDFRDTIYIVSDFAQYNSVNLNSKFYDNVIIDYQDKKITCVNFDINMDSNKAVAYNDVVITDPKSIMKAGIVEFDLKTKNININPENISSEIEVITN